MSSEFVYQAVTKDTRPMKKMATLLEKLQANDNELEDLNLR